MPKAKKIYLGDQLAWPVQNYYYSEANRNEYQSLVDSVWSVQFQDSGRRFRFNNGCYIWNRVAVDVNGTTFRKINLDTLTATSSKSSTVNGRIWYFGDNRILTPYWIMDFDGNMVTTFSTSFNTITPGLPWVVWANVNFDIYKGEVSWDDITFTKVGTWWTDQSAWQMFYWYLWAYLLNYNDTSWSGYSSYINPETNAITNFTWGSNSRQDIAASWADGKLYRIATRYNGFWKLQKIGTWDEGFVWTSVSTSWTQYGRRFWKFLWNIVSWWMGSNQWTGNWYGSNNYFIWTDGTLTRVQTNAFAYDTNIYGNNWFIDENWYIYPRTDQWWSWVILKTDKTFTDLNRKNPYLYR